jgi:serine/threonine-protein kinase
MSPQVRIHGYEVLERIGSGAESAIYRARERSSGRIVAVKHVVVEKPENEKYLRHVRNEYKVLRSLENGSGTPPAGIVRVYRLMKLGFLRRRKEHILVLEFVHGPDMRRERRYPLGQMLHILTDVASALAAVHARGLIHGDLKPENIIVGLAGKPTVVDFGFSCKAGSWAESIRGTRDYMAPEQVDRGRLTEKTDIYNFGASMYFLFAARHVPALIAGPDDSAHYIVSRKVDVPPVRTFNPSVPTQLDEMILRCVKKDALERPSCIEEVREVLLDLGKRYSDG